MSCCLQQSESPAVCHFITNNMEGKKIPNEEKINEKNFFFRVEAFQLHSSLHSLCLVLTVIFLSYICEWAHAHAHALLSAWFLNHFPLFFSYETSVSKERQIWIKIVLMMSFQRRSPTVFFLARKIMVLHLIKWQYLFSVWRLNIDQWPHSFKFDT